MFRLSYLGQFFSLLCKLGSNKAKNSSVFPELAKDVCWHLLSAWCQNCEDATGATTHVEWERRVQGNRVRVAEDTSGRAHSLISSCPHSTIASSFLTTEPAPFLQAWGLHVVSSTICWSAAGVQIAVFTTSCKYTKPHYTQTLHKDFLEGGGKRSGSLTQPHICNARWGTRALLQHPYVLPHLTQPWLQTHDGSAGFWWLLQIRGFIQGHPNYLKHITPFLYATVA